MAEAKNHKRGKANSSSQSRGGKNGDDIGNATRPETTVHLGATVGVTQAWAINTTDGQGQTITLQESKNPASEPTLASASTPPPKAVEKPPKRRNTTPEVDNVAPERLGENLRRAREQRGEKIVNIADYLRIKPSFLAALESSRYDQIPADAYAIGFLRSYAMHLGLDGREAIDRYRREMAGRRKKPQLNMPQPIYEGKSPTIAIIIGAILAAAIIYGMWYGSASSDREAADVPPPMPVAETVEEPLNTTLVAPPPVAQNPAPSLSTVTPPIPAIAAPVAPVALPRPVVPAPLPTTTNADPAIAPPPPAVAPRQIYGDNTKTKVAIRALQESWVMITDGNGTPVFSKLLRAGDVYHVPDLPNMQLTTGNVGGVVVSLDGRDLPPIKSDSRVVRNLSLAPASLKAGNSRTGQ